MVSARICVSVLIACASQPAFAELSPPNVPNPSLGALNNITPKMVVDAARLARIGKVYSLANPTTPRVGKEPPFRSYHVRLEPFVGGTMTGFEDTVTLSPSLGTSVDGLGHVGRNGIHYNGVRAKDISGPEGAKIYGIETLPPIVTRGVLLDLARHLGVPVVPAGTAVSQTMIEAMASSQGVKIRRGDVVLLHTGWPDATEAMKKKAGNPGFGLGGARYLANIGVVAVGGDAGAEVNPAEQSGEVAPVHQLLIADKGIYLLEGVRTKDLAHDRVYEFLFVMAAPKLTGSIQANVHPVAIM